MILNKLLSLAQVPLLTGGFVGTPLPYSLRNDDALVLLLLGCFLISSIALYYGKRFLTQQGKSFIFHRERASIFSDSTSTDMRSSLWLLLQTCLMEGFVVFAYAVDSSPSLVSSRPAYLWVCIYAGLFIVYHLLKWLLYLFLGWIYVDRTKTNSWLESYLLLLYYLGFVLFLFVLVLIYFSLSSSIIFIIGCILLLFAKILVFYKWFKLFLNNLSGLLLLILYFCALEITPCLLLYQGIIEINRL